MTDFIEENTGKKLRADRLAETMERSRRSLENYRQALRLKFDRSESLKMTSHMIDAFALHVLREPGKLNIIPKG